MIYDVVEVKHEEATATESRTAEVIGEFRRAVEALSVKNNDDLDYAHKFFTQAKALRDVIEDLTEPFRKAAYEHYKHTQQTKKNLIEPLDDAVETLRERVVEYYRGHADRLLSAVAEGNGMVDLEEIAPIEQAMDSVSEKFDLRKYHKAKVVDMEAFLRYVIETGKFELVSANHAELNGLARRMEGNISVDGVETYHTITPVPKRNG